MASPSTNDRGHPRWVLPALLGAIGVLVVMNTTGGLLYSSLVQRRPALLLVLNATNKVLLGVTNHLDPVTYYGIGFVRLSVADPLFYVLGLLYGDAAIRWIERKAGDGAATFLWFEKAFKKARYPVVLLAPNNVVCLLAGATGMPIPVFLALNVTGTVGRLYLVRRLGEAFQAPIEAVTGFLDRYRWQIVAVSVALFVLQSALKKKAPAGIGDLRELEREAEVTGETGPARTVDLDQVDLDPDARS